MLYSLCYIYVWEIHYVVNLCLGAWLCWIRSWSSKFLESSWIGDWNAVTCGTIRSHDASWIPHLSLSLLHSPSPLSSILPVTHPPSRCPSKCKILHFKVCIDIYSWFLSFFYWFPGMPPRYGYYMRMPYLGSYLCQQTSKSTPCKCSFTGDST